MLSHLRMKPCHPFPVFFLLMLLACCASAADDRGLQLLEVIVGAPGSGLSISETQLIKPTPTPWAHDSLRPVWHAKVLRDGKESGYLMWESEGTGKLIEFSLNRTERSPAHTALKGCPISSNSVSRDNRRHRSARAVSPPLRPIWSPSGPPAISRNGANFAIRKRLPSPNSSRSPHACASS